MFVRLDLKNELWEAEERESLTEVKKAQDKLPAFGLLQLNSQLIARRGPMAMPPALFVLRGPGQGKAGKLMNWAQ